MIEAATDSGNPDRFEKAIRDAFAYLGFRAEWLGGAGKTDVLLDAPLDKVDSYRAIVDAKSTGTGSLSDQQVDWVTLTEHREKHDADYVALVGPNPKGGRIFERAATHGVSVISSEQLAGLCRQHSKAPLGLDTYRALFDEPGALDTQLVDEKAEELDLLIQLAGGVLAAMRSESSTFGRLSARDLYLLLSHDPASEGTSEEEIQGLLDTLASPLLGLVLGTRDAGYRVTSLARCLAATTAPVGRPARHGTCPCSRSRRAVSTTEAQSFFGWLDYDDKAAERMREVFAAFDDQETIDSLGVGVIRDAISNRLFPGISTIQTRARYFLFIPWICQILEREKGLTPKQFGGRLRELELALVESLRDVEGADQGVIGYRARKRLIRLPSTVYWNGLRVFGIRLQNVSTAEYRNIAARLATTRAQVETDDDGEALNAIARMWDPGLPAPPPRFPHDPISMTLTAEESEYLAGKMVASRPETMIGELARDLELDRSAALPWEVPLHNPPERLSATLRHARNFSELMQGAQALYNVLLARRAEEIYDHDKTDLLETLTSELDDWADLIDERKNELAQWVSGDEFWRLVEHSTRVPLPTRRFVLAWADLALARPRSVATDPAARDPHHRTGTPTEGQARSPHGQPSARRLERSTLQPWPVELSMAQRPADP